MGMKNSKTICYKHSEIIRLAEEIQSLCLNDIKIIDLSKVFSDILNRAEQIDELAADAMYDGQSMENGLSSKRNKLKEFEKEKEELESKNSELEEELLDIKITLEVE